MTAEATELGASFVKPWQEDLRGRVRLNCGGKLVAENSRASKGVYVVYIPPGEKFTVGYKDGSGVFRPATADYTAVATSGKCFCKVRLRLRPSVKTLSSGVELAPLATPAKSERYYFGQVWLSDKAKITPAIKIGDDVLELSGEATAVAVGVGTKCSLRFGMKLLASKNVPPEPLLEEAV